MAWAQLSDSEGSHSADSVLYGTVEAAKRKSSHSAKWCWDQLGGQENLARVFQQKIAAEGASLDATSEGLRTKTAVSRRGHELPECASPKGTQFGILRKPPFPPRAC